MAANVGGQKWPSRRGVDQGERTPKRQKSALWARLNRARIASVVSLGRSALRVGPQASASAGAKARHAPLP